MKKKKGGADTLTNMSADTAPLRNHGVRASHVLGDDFTTPQAFKLLKETSFCSF